jgi:hypothetical protein
MADYKQEAKVPKIANFKHDNREFVGHMVSFKVGGEELKQEFNFFDPMDPSKRVPLAGMLTLAIWDKTPGGVLFLEGRIPAATQGILQDAMDSHDKSADCEFKLDFYKYDVATATYFKCFHTDGQVIEGKLSEKQPSNVEDAYDHEYDQIKNHVFRLAIVGSDKKDQLLHIAYDTERKKAFPFGQKCGG